jgi:hypothetical protein
MRTIVLAIAFIAAGSPAGAAEQHHGNWTCAWDGQTADGFDVTFEGEGYEITEARGTGANLVDPDRDGTVVMQENRFTDSFAVLSGPLVTAYDMYGGYALDGELYMAGMLGSTIECKKRD